MYDELINDLLNEASDLLNESAGKNGMHGRLAYKLYKRIKANHDANEAKYGYDKTRLYEEIAKNRYDDDQNHKRFTGSEKLYWKDPKNPVRIKYERERIKQNNDWVKGNYNLATTLYNVDNPHNKITRKELSDKQKALHDKINQRAGINESVELVDLLVEAAELLSMN